MAAGMDGDTAGRWLSYAELAEVRGTDKTSALKLALRKRWPRRKDNHGTMQVCVPPEWLNEWGARKSAAVPPDVASGMADGMDSSANQVLEAAVASLSEARDQAEKRAAEANKRADVAVALAERTIGQLAEANIRAERAEAMAQGAREVADDLRRADEARRARGRWARLRAVWRGE
jgi:hypothetical protein